jgi:predicted RNase H-like nuclease (RuvC/YqgF family)
MLRLPGWPHAIRAGKPVYQAAFSRLVEDSVFAATMDLQSYNYLITVTKDEIKSYEEEIDKLSAPFSGRAPREIESRIRYLLKKLADGQKAIETYEAEVKKSKDIISKSWSGK